jgi:hypothetical protein
MVVQHDVEPGERVETQRFFHSVTQLTTEGERLLEVLRGTLCIPEQCVGTTDVSMYPGEYGLVADLRGGRQSDLLCCRIVQPSTLSVQERAKCPR